MGSTKDQTIQLENDDQDAVKVYLRIKPNFSSSDTSEKIFNVLNDKELLVVPPTDSYAFKNTQRKALESNHRFSFTKIFDKDYSQENVFKMSLSNEISNFIQGYNSLTFTYGVTSSGKVIFLITFKTFTLVGNKLNPGLLHRSLNFLFDSLQADKISNTPNYAPVYYNSVLPCTQENIDQLNNIKSQLLNLKHSDSDKAIRDRISSISSDIGGWKNFNFKNTQLIRQVENEELDINDPQSCHVYISIAEIYNEQIFDLLNIQLINKLKSTIKRSPLSIGEDPFGFSYIKNLNHVLVDSVEDALKILHSGEIQRHVAKTKLNMKSSRSHVVYTIKVIKAYQLPNEVITKSNQMCFVDLAGSERHAKSQSEGKRLKEASNINLSLLVLGKCIESLKANRVNGNLYSMAPFRESKLTRLLQPFFINTSNINLFANINTTLDMFDETLNVLRFSSITKDALSRPATLNLMEATEADAVLFSTDKEFLMMNKNELIRKIKYLVKYVDMLELKMADMEASIRKECHTTTQQILHSMEETQKKYSEETKNNIITMYKEKMKLLEEYYQQLLEDRSTATVTCINSTYDKNETYTVLNAKDDDFDKSAEIRALRDELEGEISTKNIEIRELRSLLNEKEEELQSSITKNSCIKLEMVTVKELLKEKEEEIFALKQIKRAAESKNLENECVLSKNNLELEKFERKYRKLNEELNSKNETIEKFKNIIFDKDDKIRKLNNNLRVMKRESKSATPSSTPSRAQNSYRVYTPITKTSNISYSPNDFNSYRRLYEEARSNIIRLEERISELTNEQVGKPRKSLKLTEDQKVPKYDKSIQENIEEEIIPSLLFKIGKVDSGVDEKKDYKERLKLRRKMGKENEESFVNITKKKLNLH